jgi:prolyl-tRNA synthetase
MKDMYSFDEDETAALETYSQVREAYNWFFEQIGLPVVSVCSSVAFLRVGWCCRRQYWRTTLS